MRQGLLAHDVGEECISLMPDEQEAITTALDCATEGDLLVVFGDNITRCWKQIIYHGGDREAPEEFEDAIDENTSGASPGLMLEDGMHLISDDRGVRLARSEEGDD